MKETGDEKPGDYQEYLSPVGKLINLKGHIAGKKLLNPMMGRLRRKIRQGIN